jgi:hypothetical protein
LSISRWLPALPNATCYNGGNPPPGTAVYPALYTALVAALTATQWLPYGIIRDLQLKKYTIALAAGSRGREICFKTGKFIL